MIKLVRVDHRLLHGQVAFSWLGFLDANCVLIANDDVPNNNIRKNSLRMAKPANVKLVMKTVEDGIDAINSVSQTNTT
ncbi:Putative PTS permease [Erysipelothrix urinaevulpis]|nr:PTS sugar transporter subunit IIB [Erysipelothrix urinaevulpis]